jgi:hypothetical protein
MNNVQVFYHNMLLSFGEKPPFIMVGWGGGGITYYEYARDHPEMVHSLVFMDTYPVDIEFKAQFVLKNWTQTQLENEKRSEFARRKTLLDLINVIAVPFGLMPLFVPSSKLDYPQELRGEVGWYFLTDRTWIAQRHWIKFAENEDDVFNNYRIDQNIPINLLSTSLSDEQVRNITCIKNRKIDPDSDECLYEIKSNRYYTEEKKKLVNLTSAGGKIVRCMMDECDLGYWVDYPRYTVDRLLEIYT